MKNQKSLPAARFRRNCLFSRWDFPLAAMAIWLTTVGAQAQWVQTGTGPYSYNAGANWVGGTPDGQFTGTFFPGGAANDAIQTITFSTDATISDLNFAPSAGSAYGNTSVQLQSTGGTARTLTLNGRIRTTAIDGANGNSLNIGSTTPASALNVVLGSSAVIEVDGGVSNRGYLSLLNAASGTGSLTKTGLGSLDILGATSISGSVNIDAGAVRVLGADGALASDNITVKAGSALMLLNSSTPQNGAGTSGASATRLNDTAVINLNGGWANAMTSFSHVNRSAFGINAPSFGTSYSQDFGNLVLEGASTGTAINEVVGSLNLQSGISRVNLRTNSTTSGNVTLTAGSLTRAVGTAVTFSGGYGNATNNNTMFLTLGGSQGGDSSIGQTYVKFTTAPTLTNGILPYALVAPDNIYGYGSGAATEFASYDASNGIVAYSHTGTYVTSLTGAVAGDNVKLSSATTVSTSGTINSLTIESSGSNYNISGSGSPTLTIASGALLRTTSNVSRTITLQNTLTLDFNNKEAFIYNSAGSLTIQSALTNIGSDGINFYAPANFSGISGQRITFEGSVTPNVDVRLLGGSMRLNANLTTNTVTVANGATLALITNPTIGGLAGEGAVRLSGLTLTVGGPSSPAGNTTFSGNIYGAELKDSVPGFAPFLTNGGNLIKSGTNSLTLSGANTYSGTTTVRQGTLIAGTDSAATLLTGATKVGSLTATTSDIATKTFTGTLSNGTAIGFPAGTAVGEGIFAGEGRTSVPVVYYVINGNGTTFQLAATPGGTAITPNANTTTDYQELATLSVNPTTNTITLPTGAGTVSDGDVIYLNPAGNVGIGTPGGLAGSTPYYVVNSVSGTNFQVARSLGGAAIDITSTGTSVFAIQPGAFGTGTTAIVMGDASSGAATKALLTGGAFSIGRDITVTGTATGGTGVTTLGGNTNDNSLFSGAVALGATTQLTSVTTGSNAVTFSGVFSGSGGLSKIGAGTVKLTGANSHTGDTQVSAGTLLINNTAGSGLGTGNVTVNGGVLGGTGALTGSITVASGGTLAPGASIETLASGTLTLNNNSTFDYEVDSGVSTAAGADLQLITGDLNLNNVVTLNLTNLDVGSFALGTTFTLLNYTGTWNGGLFTYNSTALANLDTFSFNGQEWQIQYDATTGGDNFSGQYLANSEFVNMTVVPEPQTWRLMIIFGMFLMFFHRHRTTKNSRS